MKNLFRIIFGLAIIILSASDSTAQWRKITTIPPPFNNGFWLDVHFLKTNPDYGWVCGYDGYVIRTTDGGSTWRGAVVGQGLQLESIHFPNERVGYTSGNGRIFRSTDGGATWRNISPAGNAELWGCFFADESTGLVLGGGCDGTQEFFRTTNGGQNWTLFRGNEPQSGLTDAMLYSSNGLGYASSSGVVWRTTDGGKSWAVFAETGGHDWQEEITNINESFLVPYSRGCAGDNSSGGIRFSTDNGLNWNDYFTGHGMYGTFLLSETEGWACGFGAGIYHTTDGGETWRQENCGISRNTSLDDIYFVNPQLGWVVGQDGVYKTDFSSFTPPVIQSDKQLLQCDGQSLVLSVPDEYHKYIWSTGETTPSITVTKSGTYSVRVIKSCDTGLAQPVSVIFAPRPDATITAKGPVEFCEGDSVLLLGPAGNFQYKWSTGETQKDIVSNKTGKYTLTITDSLGCSDTAQISVVVNPLPAPKIIAQEHTTFCIGDSITLQSSQDYAKYEWRNIFVSDLVIGTQKQITVKASGLYVLSVETTKGCISNSDAIVVTVKLDTNQLEISSLDVNPIEILDTTAIGNITCKTITIRNIGTRSFTLTNAMLLRNLQFSFPQSQFPVIIPVNQTATLNVCFTPADLGTKRDTVLLIDNCSPRFIPLLSEGISKILPSDTRCDAPVIIKTFAAGGIVTSFSYPFPQPAEDFISLTVSIASGGERFPFGNCKLLSAQSVEMALSKSEIIEEKNTAGQKISTAKFSFDTSTLSAGVYFIYYKDDAQEKIFPVIVNGKDGSF